MTETNAPANAGIWTVDALNTELYDRVTRIASGLEAVDKRNDAGAERIARRHQAVLRELISLADTLGCAEAAEIGREVHSLYFHSSI